MTDSSSATSDRRWTPITLGGDGPPPKGAYSPGIRAGDFLYVSGQVPRDRRTGSIVGNSVAEQTRQVVTNLEAVLKAGGATLEDVVSVTAYLANDDDWEEFNTEYRRLFRAPYPTRTTVGAGLRDVLVEISAVAWLGGKEP